MTSLTDRGDIPAEQLESLRTSALTLQREFAGDFSGETIERFLLSSYDSLVARQSETSTATALAERFTRQRLSAIAILDTEEEGRSPVVLFLCTHNAGRSQMALGFLRQLGGDAVIGWSGGSEPGELVNPAAVTAMAELGIDITGEFPKPWTDEIVRAADVVVTMGCGDACPVFPGKRYEDWALQDPAGLAVDNVRPIRDEIQARVQDLLSRLGVPEAR